MDVGMLWFDNDSKREVAEKVERAAAYYRQKYGKAPTVCHVHPSMIEGDRQSSGRVEIRANGTVLPNHFWVGVNGVEESDG